MREAKLKLEADLRETLEHQSLDVYYQPIVRIDDRSLHGFEALVRWLNPSVGLISPEVFVPLAEELASQQRLTISSSKPPVTNSAPGTKHHLSSPS